MIEQLVLAKRLFVIGSQYADKQDPVSAGMSISMFQDAVEIFIWSLLKELDAQARDNTPFTSFFDLVLNASSNEEGKRLPLKAKILELNKARVNFKHYGNLPDCSEARKFRAYTEEFLTLSYLEFFDTDFESVSLLDLVGFPDVRDQLKSAEAKLHEKDFVGCIAETAIARSMVFAKVAEFFPQVDRNLSDGDRIFRDLSGIGKFQYFSYIEEYLKKSREASIVSLLGVPMRDYVLMQRYFPAVAQVMSGDWKLRYCRQAEPDDEVAQKAVQMITNIAIKAQEVLGDA